MHSYLHTLHTDLHIAHTYILNAHSLEHHKCILIYSYCTYIHLILIIYLRMLHFIGTSLLFLQLLIAPKMIPCLVSSIIVGLLIGKGLCIHTNIHTYYITTMYICSDRAYRAWAVWNASHGWDVHHPILSKPRKVVRHTLT